MRPICNAGVTVLVMLLFGTGTSTAQILIPDFEPIWVRMADGDGELDTFLDRPTSTESAEFSPDETLVASVAKGDNSVRLWQVEDGVEVWVRFADAETEAISFTRDGRYLVTGGEDAKLRVWSVEDGTVVKTLEHVASIEGLRFSHDGSMLATGNEAGELNIWDTSDTDPTHWPDMPLHTVIHGPDQDHPDGAPSGVHADINQVDWTNDDEFVITASRNAEVKMWEVARFADADGGFVRSFLGHSDSIKSARLSPDGKLVAAGAQNSPDGAARVWEVETGNLIAEILRPNIRIVESVEFTPDGQYLVVGGTEHRSAGPGRFYFYRVSTLTSGARPIPALEVPVFNQEYFDFTHDGKKLLSAHADGSLRLWSIEDREHPLTAQLRPHPRLLFTPDRESNLHATAASDTLLQAVLEVIEQYAESALDEPIVAYEFDEPDNPPQTKRLKAQRRASMLRVMNLALTYRMTGDERYAERAREDLLAAASFPDWWPPHFLNVGEFAATVALGYDWLHDFLTVEHRQAIREGLIRNALQPGLEAYDGASFGNWVRQSNNWNQVCNGGLVLAALAVAEEHPELAQAVLNEAVKSLPRAMESYLPDGAWEEGPTYWAYGTTYNGILLDALSTATDSLFGLSEADGYEEMGRSGLFHVQTVGPTNLYYNYGDAKRVAFFSPVLFWMSHHFDEPVYAWYERELIAKDLSRMRSGALMQEDTLDRFLALLAVWYNGAGTSLSYDDLPYDTHFEGSASVAAMRSGWTDDALYLAFKGGDIQSHHGHMDIGSFVLDADGVRWALDLGGDDYGLPGYFNFSGPRWDYYRLNNLGHNTLVLADDLQYLEAVAPIETFVTSPDLAYGVVNMSSAYSNHTVQAHRGFAVLDRVRVMIQDQLTPLYAGYDIRWGMITAADISTSGSTAVLQLDGRTLRADVLEPEGGQFEVLDTNPEDSRQDDNEGTAMLSVTVPVLDRSPKTLTVLLTPLNEETEDLPTPTFRPLDPVGTYTATATPSASFKLNGVYPNPLRSNGRLTFSLPDHAEVSVEVFDLLGRRVMTVPGASYLPGDGLSIELNAGQLSSGTYAYRLIAQSASQRWVAQGRFVIVK